MLLPLQLQDVPAATGSEQQEVHTLTHEHLPLRPLHPLLLSERVVVEKHLR
ncbi:hypothetical protein J7E87_31020 [Streptomyces sp. ISL-1]|uniref:hypothetical protein n=1 Tax=Streptomyces sp. ISL-1 TaxID=2817657 RepID=UPI001BE7AF7F|nr:hypothetical protein [Streptomyces sp. ISL-1]MBT2393722.1 hypothetical protein [Streptomyces sp. ISL-1]